MIKHDIVVVGGGFTGAAAAIAAAREGADVLLVEKGNSLGGASVNSLVNPFMPNATKITGVVTELSQGLFMEIENELNRFADKYHPNRKYTNKRTFNEEYLKIILNRMAQESGVHLLFHCMLIGANTQNGKIASIQVASPSGVHEIEGNIFIDCTGDMNLGDTVTEKFTSGKAAVVMGISTNGYGTTEDALTGAIEGATMDVFGPIKDANGKAAAGGTTGLNAISAIPAISSHQEDAMKYINAKLEDETFKISTIGEEGYTHKKISDTEYEPIAPTFLEELNYGSNFLIGADDVMYPIYWKQCRLKKDIRNYDAAVKMMEGTNIVQVDPMKISPLLPTYCEYTTALEQSINDFTVSVICGTASVDDLDTFAQQYMADGGAEVKKEINEWWATYRDTYYKDYGYTLE